MSKTPPFARLARDPGATLDVLALALAAEFRDVDAADAMRTLDILGAELSRAAEQTNGRQRRTRLPADRSSAPLTDSSAIKSEHVLLALLRDDEGVAVRILLDCKIDLLHLRDEVIVRTGSPRPATVEPT